VTTSWSASVMEPMPARTRFFAISFARALIETRRMLAVRILSWSVAVLAPIMCLSLLLRLDTPESDLAIVEGDFVCKPLSALSSLVANCSYLQISCRLRQWQPRSGRPRLPPGMRHLRPGVVSRTARLCRPSLWCDVCHGCVIRSTRPRGFIVGDAEASLLTLADLRCDGLLGKYTILGEIAWINTR
jgi:hypothetical protein